MPKSRKPLIIILLILFLAVLIAVGIIVFRKKTPVEAGGTPDGLPTDMEYDEAEEEPPEGWLEIKGADFIGHEIRNAATGAAVAKIDSIQSTITLPAGTYDVGFGATFWKGVVVKKGETTVLEPGAIALNHASLSGHDVIAADTGIVQGRVSSIASHIVLVPGAYEVKFGPLSWPVEVKAGETTVIEPGIVEVEWADISGHKIYDLSGALIGEVSATGSSMPLPPGEYSIDLDGASERFSITAGRTTLIHRK
jgi:hypothetical protein